VPAEAAAQQADSANSARVLPADSLADSIVLYATADGDTIAQLRPGITGQIVQEDGEWVRVRIDGWVPRSEAAAFGLPQGGSLRLAALRADPDRYRDETVRWRVQFVALQRADHLRSDMEAGEHYMLVRDPGGEPGFAYVVVAPNLLATASGLAPLQRVEIVGRIRVGSSPLTGHPILDLLEIVL
jgi:hypothetical protein